METHPCGTKGYLLFKLNLIASYICKYEPKQQAKKKQGRLSPQHQPQILVPVKDKD